MKMIDQEHIQKRWRPVSRIWRMVSIKRMPTIFILLLKYFDWRFTFVSTCMRQIVPIIRHRVMKELTIEISVTRFCVNMDYPFYM